MPIIIIVKLITDVSGPQISHNVSTAHWKYGAGLFAKCLQRRLLLDVITIKAKKHLQLNSQAQDVRGPRYEMHVTESS